MIAPLASADLAGHAPIYIDGNSNFTHENGVASGSGTESDPYIIENWNISSTSGACISITNTDAYFIVRNCTLSGSPSTAVIVLSNVTNGRVEGNTVSGGFNGISLSSSTNNTITNNTCSSNNYGISLSSSSSNTLTNNTCSSNTNCGIRLYSSSTNNTITNNTCSSNTDYGIYLSYSSSNTLTNNTCSSNNYCGIYLAFSSSSNTLTNNTCSSNNYGISLSSSSSNTLTNNTCSSNSYGIYLDSSNHNLSAVITGNMFSYNYEGAYLEGLCNFTMSGNTALNNSEYGIMINYCQNGTMQNNAISGSRYNFGVDGWELPYFIHDIDASNTVEGRSVQYLVSLSGIEVPADAGFIGIVNCTDVNATGQDVSRNYEGLLIAYSNGTTAEDVRLRLNYYGAYILFSSGTVIADSTLSNDEYGASSYSSSTAYSGDTIRDCYYGIEGMTSSDVIANSNITGCGTAASYSYEDWHDYNFTAYGNTLRDNTDGFSVPSPQNANITHNCVYNSTNCAIYTSYCPALITGNLIDVAGNGIYLSCCEGAIVHGNTIANATIGIKQVDESQDNSFIGNSISNVGTGIIIGWYHWHNQNYNTTIAFNTVTNFTSFGFEVHYVDGGDISNNTATGAAAGTGICLEINNDARNVVVSGNSFSAAQTGIYVNYVPNLAVSLNNISACGTGILLMNCYNGTTSGNTIAGCGYGITLLSYNQYLVISNNTVTGSSLAGIHALCSGMCETSDYLNISFNTLLDNRDGMSLTAIMHSTIHNNTVANGTNYGIALYSTGPCSNITVCYNELLNNTINAYDDTAAVNLWDYNFYSDYTGPDRNCDRIGDIPYDIAGGSNQDLHPLVRDTLPPYFIHFLPANGSLMPASGTIYVTYADATSSIVTPLCRLLLNGMDVSASASFGQNAMAYDYGMPTGTVDVRIYIEDCCGHSAWLNWSFDVDAQAPSVAIISPAGGSCVNSASPVIAASYSDGGAGIDLSRVRVYVDGADVSASASIASSSASYTPAALADGEHTVSVAVFDNVGNSASASWTFCVDTAAPVLASSSPANGTVTSGTGITASFTFVDALSGIDAIGAVMTVDGGQVAFSADVGMDGGFTFTHYGEFAEGAHTASMEVADAAGNVATASLVFTVDTTPPEVSAISPANASLVAASSPVVAAQFSDLNGIDASSVALMIDGTDVTGSASVGGSGISVSVHLSEGAHTVGLTVADAAGNAAIVNWSFTVDTTPPQITGLAPADGALTNNSRPAISAAFSDATSGIAAASARILINGTDATSLASVTPAGIAYTPVAPIPDGAATVTVRVSDNAGNEATATWSFTVDTRAPPAPSSPLANGSTVAAGAFQFNASFSGAGPLPGSVRLLIDGVDVTSNATVTATGISCSVTLPAGSHTITLLVTDAAGNTASAFWTINASEAAAGGGADMTLVYFGIVAVVVILGAAAAYLAMRKK